MTMVSTPVQIIETASEGLLAKSRAPLGTMIVSAMFAGAMIAMGFIFFVTTQMGWADFPVGLAKLLGGVVFSTGLGLVIITGADLFTSTSMTTFLVLERAMKVRDMLRHWAIVYFANMLGAFLVAVMVYFAGTASQGKGAWGEVVLNASVAKVSAPFTEMLFRGILCNILVCLAVWLAFAGKTLVDKIVAVVFPIGLFVASGFEHCVANMFLIPLGLLLKGHVDVDASALTVTSYLANNLLPVTIGNIIGGSIIALGMAFWHRDTRAGFGRRD